MSTGGVVYKDLLPIPDTDPTEHEGKSTTLRNAPTESHALALDAAKSAPPEEKGAAQIAHGDEVVDLGWNEPKELVAKPLVGGLGNEDLWLLVRRFNKQMYHVKEIPTAPPGGLDMNIADEEEFSPDKLRANIERLYMTLGIGLMGFGKHIVRIRSWRESRRTAWFCSAYFAAWFLDMIMPLIAVTLVTLIVYPPARDTMFPPAPIALVSSKGGVQKPKSGTLGSTDSATGAPENHKGEAVEQEASNFVNGFATIALSSATGKHPQGEPPDEDSPDSSVPDPTRIAISAADAKDQAAGVKSDKHHDKTKVPMETAMWTKMRPIMHGIADVTDTWERFANMLEPTSPFPKDKFHLRLAAVVAPLVLVSLFVTSYMFMKGVTFSVGFGFFGDPVIQRGLALLNRKFPNWQKLLELRNTLLKGVPTNAQLTVPIGHSMQHKKSFDEAMAHDPTTAHETGGEDIDNAKDSKHGKKGTKILNFFRGTVKGGVETTMTADKVKAAAGSTHAKNRLGAVPPREWISHPVLSSSEARHDGKRGHVYITTKATIPCIAFSTDKTIEKIGEIMEMKKVGGFGWKAKLVVGWAMGRSTDGLIIIDRQLNEYRITALPLRDELFNRLVAMGGQKWECW
ncbi:unnamed protein product [Alternaria alternata]